MRETTSLAPTWGFGWYELARGLLESGEYDESVHAWNTAEGLDQTNSTSTGDVFTAVIHLRRTGERRPIAVPAINPIRAVWLHACLGERERALEIFNEQLIRPGAFGMAAHTHHPWLRELLEDDPEYRTLLAKARIHH